MPMYVKCKPQSTLITVPLDAMSKYTYVYTNLNLTFKHLLKMNIKCEKQSRRKNVKKNDTQKLVVGLSELRSQTVLGDHNLCAIFLVSTSFSSYVQHVNFCN